MKTLILNYYKKTILAENSKEAIDFINSLPGISVNDYTKANIINWFEGKSKYFIRDIATTGCGNTRIKTYIPLGKTLEEHQRVYEQKLIESKKSNEIENLNRLEEMKKEEKGWYVVQLDCYEQDLIKGGHKQRFTNWRILAESPIDAYNKAVSSAEEKGFFWFTKPINCQIDFVGIWNDFLETIYNN